MNQRSAFILIYYQWVARLLRFAGLTATRARVCVCERVRDNQVKLPGKSLRKSKSCSVALFQTTNTMKSVNYEVRTN